MWYRLIARDGTWLFTGRGEKGSMVDAGGCISLSSDRVGTVASCWGREEVPVHC